MEATENFPLRHATERTRLLAVQEILRTKIRKTPNQAEITRIKKELSFVHEVLEYERKNQSRKPSNSEELDEFFTIIELSEFLFEKYGILPKKEQPKVIDLNEEREIRELIKHSSAMYKKLFDSHDFLKKSFLFLSIKLDDADGSFFDPLATIDDFEEVQEISNL